jgi:membrane-bound lytic murein transglycosylase D
MKLQKILLLLLFTGSAFAQDDAVINPIPIKISYLDSIKASFVNYNVASTVDSLWINELNNDDLYKDITENIATIDLNQNVDYELPTELLKQRLAEMDAKSPFNIEYNVGLENIIKSFLKNRRKSFERLMGLSEYYFPLFEDAFAKKNVPLEIKYLAVVESALNPKAVSRVGATGLWQFMYQTGKQYKLNIDSYVDERSDPLKASEAAAQYMTNMYKIFGDWDLCLAAYNSGAGNVTKAIRRSGGLKNYWNIRKNLPQETAGYVPAFLATMYIYEYHKEHGIVPQRAPVKQFATDTIQIKKQISFQHISDLLNIPVSQIQLFNPSYKLSVVPSYTDKPHYLRLPLEQIAVFTSNEDKIYAYAEHEYNKREKVLSREELVAKDESLYETSYKFVNRTKYHKVRRGEDLSEIANRYKVSMSEIKGWNRLRSNAIKRGRSLKIISNERVTVRVRKDKATKNAELQSIESVAEVQPSVIYEKQPDVVTQKEENETPKEVINGKYTWVKSFANKEVVKTYKIKKGDNLSEIADKYNVSVSEIKKWNRLKSNVAQRGQNIKIVVTERVATRVKKPIKEIESTEEVVQQEQQLAPSGEKYAVLTPIKNENAPEDVVYEAPKKAERIVEPKTPKAYKYEKVVTYKDVTKNYKVRNGDNLGEIAEKHNVGVSDLKKWNKLKGNNVVVVGKTLKIISNEKVVTTVKKLIKSSDDLEPTEYYTVQKGDNLASIAKKNNITVEELKEWNNLSSNKVQLKSKLKVADIANTTSEINDENSTDYAAPETNFKTTEYVVQQGDNIGTIARKHKVSITDIQEWNQLQSDNIQAGTKIIVSKKSILDKNNAVAKTFKNQKESKKKEQLYYVKKGDSLFSIAQKQGVTVQDIKKWNGIRGNELKPGMKLKISG